VLDRLRGHVWTIAPHLADRLRPTPAPADAPWSCTLRDDRMGEVVLGGRLARTDSDTLVLLVHGLGGSADSPYVRKAAAAVAARGWSYLRVDLRGADGRGEDLYHAGLCRDLAAALSHPQCAFATRVFVIGFSLGGHVSLRLASEPGDPRLAAVVAVCAPLDLARAAAVIDAPRKWVYRMHVLQALLASYRAVAARRGDRLPTPLREVEAVRTIRDWDRLVVVPRHGFASVEDYWAQASVAPRLSSLRVRAAWFGTRWDPMITHGSVAPVLAGARGGLEVHWLEPGGHVGVPSTLADGRSVEDRLLRWLDAAAPA
jgi:predicted alpha/beta-fold hydrolase